MKSRVLEFGEKRVNPDIRKLKDMEDVIYDAVWLETAPNTDLYYMYRDLALSERDHSLIKDNDLRYDITIIPPSSLGSEYVKTAGHYHPEVIGQKYTYPEVYEVLEGVAHYLLQKRKDSQNSQIIDVVMIEAREGDKVIVPPHYGHVTINPSDVELKMANWVSRNFSSIYGPYKDLRGAAYYELTEGDFVSNEKYEHLPEVRYLKPTNVSEIGFYKDKKMYDLVKNIENLNFLNHPQDFNWLWDLVLMD